MFQQTIAALDATLTDKSWAVGDQFTLADAALAPYFQMIDQFGWNGFLADAPKIAGWFDRARRRNSFRSGILDQYESGQLESLRRMGAAEWPKIAARLSPR